MDSLGLQSLIRRGQAPDGCPAQEDGCPALETEQKARQTVLFNCYLSLALLILLLLPTGLRAAESSSFRSDIAPILLENCVACHSAKKAEGGYRVDTFEELIKPGDSGEAPVSAESESELLRRILSDDESERMPAESQPLSPEQIQSIKDWIAGGGQCDAENPADPLGLIIPPLRYAPPPETYARGIPITAIGFTPDGSQLLVGGYHELLVWDVESLQLARRIQNIGQRVFAVAFDADEKTLAVACGEPGKSGEVRLVDFESGEVRAVIARTNDVVYDVAFRPGTHQLAVASADKLVRIFNIETLHEERTIASHADWVMALAWSDDGRLLATASRDKSAKVHDADTGDLLATYSGHGEAVRGICILPDGKQVVSVGADKKLHRWEVEGAKRVAEVGLGGEAFKIIRGAEHVWVPTTAGKLLRIDLSKNAISQEFLAHADWVLSAAQHAGRELVAAGGFDGHVRLWTTADGSQSQSWLAKP